MKSIKTSISARLAALLFGAALFGLASQSALAVGIGTPAGTTISNTATLSYTVGAVAQTPVPSAPVTFLVSNKVNMTVVKNDLTIVTTVSGSAPVTTGNTSFTVTNVGNNTQVFGVTPSALASGTANPFGGPVSTFALTSCSINTVTFPASGTYTTGGGGAYPNYISGLASGDSATVTVTCVVPANQLDASTAVDQLLATATTAAGAAILTSTAGAANPAVVQTVVVPAGSIYSATDAYLVQTAILAVTKSQAVICDQVNGSTNPKYIPGAYVQYAITIANSGSTAATLSQVTDALQVADLAFDGTLISGVGGVANCNSGVASQSGTGFAAVKGAGTTTSYTAPGPGNLTQAVTAGADFNVTTPNQVTINFPTLAGTAIGAAGTSTTLNANSYITVFFNTQVK